MHWHSEPIANPYQGFLELVCQQHSFNFLLWHEEDIARSPDATDSKIAAVKRAIDGYNQKRTTRSKSSTTHWSSGCEAPRSRMAQCAFEHRNARQCDRSAVDHCPADVSHGRTGESRDANLGHRAKARSRLEILARQQHDLATSLGELLDDIFAGRKRLEVYRQFKMYNDPTLNPYLYAAGEKNKAAV